MDAEREALLQRVLASPQDEGPRLVLSDWLLEHGEPELGEFIALQCSLARREPVIDWRSPSDRWSYHQQPPDTVELDAAMLERKHGKAWAAPLRGFVRKSWFRRGFVERVSLRLTRYAELVPQVRARTPLRVVRLLRYKDEITPELMREIATSPHLEGLEGLELEGFMNDQLLEALLTPPTLVTELSFLALTSGGFSIKAIERLAGHPWRRLEALDLRRCHLGDAEVEALVGIKTLRRLISSYDRISDRGLIALAVATHLTAMDDTFIAGGSQITDAGVEALCQAPQLSNLRALILNECRIGARAAKAFETSPLSSLRTLHLDRGSPIGEAGGTALAKATPLSKLERLSLIGAKIGDAGLRALAERGPFTKLQSLCLESNDICDAGAEALAKSEQLTQLRFLSLENNHITDEGAAALAAAASGSLRGLTTFILRHNPIGKQRVRELRKAFGVGVCKFSQTP